MATNVVFNGVTYSVPAVNEEDWQSLSNYLIALANAVPSGGSVSSNIRVSTSATTAVATSDYAVAINYSSGPATVNLPAGVAKQIFIITDASGTAATNNITINRNGTNTIFGGTSYVLTHNNQSVIIGFSGGNWYRLAESIPGAVEGPASSVVGGVAAFNNTTGDRLQDLGVGAADDVLRTNGTTPSFGKVVNANVSASAAIAYSKLALTNSIVNADISSGAAIAYSKLNLTGTIVNADVSASAAIAYSKLNLTASITNSDIFGAAAIAYSKLNLSGSIVNADINASAGIVYSKLNLTGGIVNADVNASAAIAYSKLNLVGSIVNADINASAAIARSKIAAGSASHVVVNDGSGNLSSVATLPVSQGGTGLNTLGSALQVLRVNSGATALEFATLAAGSGDVVGPSSSVTNGIVQFASTTGKAIKDLGVGTANTVLRTDGTTPNFGTITNAYIDAAAAISYSKMESLTALKALVTNGSGALITHPNTTADEIGYLFGVSSNIQTQLNAKLNLSGGTLTGALTINTASNQLVLGSGVNALTVNGGTSAAARTYTVPDVGTTADFVMTAGAQTVGGAKTLTDVLTVQDATVNASIAVKSLSTTVNNNDLFGVLNFVSSDASTDASGTRVQIAGQASDSGGGTGAAAFVVNIAGQSTTSLTEVFRAQSIGTSTFEAYFSNCNVGIGTTSPNISGSTSFVGLTITNLATGTSPFAGLELQGNRSAGAGNQFGRIYFYNNTVNSASMQAVLAASGVNSGELAFSTKTHTGSLTEAVRISESGNVGIGTTSPNTLSKLHILEGTNYALRIENTDAGGGYWYIGQTDNGFASGGGKLVFVPDTTGSGSATFALSNTGAVTLGPSSVTPYASFHTTNKNISSGTPDTAADLKGGWSIAANAFWVTNYLPTRLTGLTGPRIGLLPRTSNTAESIVFACNQTGDAASGVSGDQIGSIRATGAWTLGPSTGNAQATHSIYNVQSNITSSVASTAHLRLINNGTVNTNGATTLFFQTTSGTGNDGVSISGRRYTTSGSPALSIRMHATSDIGTEVAYCSDAGAWTLGPSGGANVQHNMYSSYASTTSNQGVLGLRSTGSASGQIFLQCNVSSTTPNGGIQRNGTTTGVQFFTGSDVRIKENITDAASVLNKLMDVKIREYTIRGETGRNIGVVAQELIDVFPEKVNKTDDGTGDKLPDGVLPWTVGEAWQYELIKAIQELNAKVEALGGA